MKMCLQLYSEKSITNYPVSRRHIWAVRILNAVDRIQDGTGGFEARITQKEVKQKILKKCSKLYAHRDADNKMDVKETSFVFRLHSSQLHGKKREFG